MSNHSCHSFPKILQFPDYIVSPYIVKNFIKTFGKPTRHVKNYVYFISDGDFVKIGIAENVDKRMIELQTGNARELKCLFAIPVHVTRGYVEHYSVCRSIPDHNAIDLETFLHKGFGASHVNGEWFDILKRINLDEWKRVLCEEVV